MKNGGKYYTMYPHDAMLPFPCYTKEDIESISVKDVYREWVYGESPVFDDLAFKRCKIYTSREECISDSFKRIEHLLESDE